MQSSTANGTFGSSTFVDGKLYSIGQSSKLSAYNCCMSLSRDEGLLSASDIRDLQFISDSDESAVVSLKLLGDSLSAQLLSVSGNEHTLTSIKEKKLVDSGVNAVRVLDDLDYGMTKMYVGTTGKCLLSCIDYSLEGSVYTQLTSTATKYKNNRKQVLGKATYAFNACDRGANAAMLIGASDGIYV